VEAKSTDRGNTAWAEVGREAGCDWRTAKEYLQEEAPTAPPRVDRHRSQTKLIDPFTGVVDEWLRRQPRLRASVIHERLVAEHGFGGTYQRVKLYVAEARPRIAPHPIDLHRRFEVLPGQQAQVDWGDEGTIETADGPRLELPLDALAQPRPVQLLRRLPGPGELLGLSPARVPPLRRRALRDPL